MNSVDAHGSDDERMGRRILDLESKLRSVLDAWPDCLPPDPIPARRTRTRHAAVDVLERALRAAEQRHPEDPRISQAQKLWKDAQALRWKLAWSARSLAVRAARRYAGSRGVSAEDLYQEGMLGLFAAAKRYEPGLDVRFVAYARWWLRAGLTHAVDMAPIVRLSSAAQATLRDLRKQIHAREVNGAGWTLAELARSTGIRPERARQVMVAHQGEVAGSRDETDVQQIIGQLPDETTPDPERAVATREEVQQLRAAMRDHLAPRERTILELRYGIGRTPESATSVAMKLSLSEERIRQLEHQSLAVLRRFDMHQV